MDRRYRRGDHRGGRHLHLHVRLEPREAVGQRTRERGARPSVRDQRRSEARLAPPDRRNRLACVGAVAEPVGDAAGDRQSRLGARPEVRHARRGAFRSRDSAVVRASDRHPVDRRGQSRGGPRAARRRPQHVDLPIQAVGAAVEVAGAAQELRVRQRHDRLSRCDHESRSDDRGRYARQADTARRRAQAAGTDVARRVRAARRQARRRAAQREGQCRCSVGGERSGGCFGGFGFVCVSGRAGVRCV